MKSVKNGVIRSVGKGKKTRVGSGYVPVETLIREFRIVRLCHQLMKITVIVTVIMMNLV